MPLAKVLGEWVTLIGVLKKFLSFDKVGHRLVACPCFLHRGYGWLNLGARVVHVTIGDFNLGCFIPLMLGLVKTSGGLVTCTTNPIDFLDGILASHTGTNS